MFKKTEETEWTRFSKALSSRDRDEAEKIAEEETASIPATQTVVAPAVRPPTPDVNVGARPASRPASADLDDEVESTIGEHTTVDGTFKSENSIRIRGTVQGEIESRRSILVDSQANVTAKVTAETVTVAGNVNGEIICSGRLEIQPSGRVIGEIDAGTLIMQEGAFFEGHLKMGGRSTSAPTGDEDPVTSQV